MTRRTLLVSVILSLSVMFVAVDAPAIEQTILGRVFKLKADIKVMVQAVDDVTIVAPPSSPLGSFLDIILTGATPGAHTYALPLDNWKVSSSGKLKFRSGGPVKKLDLKQTKLNVLIVSDFPAPANPTNYAGVVLTIDGNKYCVNFGGAAQGIFAKNDADRVTIKRPVSESVCPVVGPADCGDGIVQMPFENCDGSNNDDACDGLCRPPGDPHECTCPYCGDSVISASIGEVCDHASLGPCTDHCASDCTECTVCLDGTITPPEHCDTNDESECTDLGTTCRLISGPDGCFCRLCGDDYLDPGEDCDADQLGVCTEGCTKVCTCNFCGDGYKAGTETCDDGDIMSGDGCDGTCMTESGYTCQGGQPSVCTPFCGDNLIRGTEQCDGSFGLGCDNDCTIQAGYACTGEPSVCTPICGDGLILSPETCDDNNTMSGDGCDSTCAVEAGYECTGQPSVCTPI